MSGTGMSTTLVTSPLDADDDVLDVVHEVGPVVRNGVEFAGRRVVLRVGGERTGQGVAEAVDAQRVEFVRHLDRRLARLDHRPGGSGEPADVGVRPALAAGHDVPVAVPLGLTATQADAVDHAGSDEPVSRGGVGPAGRVRSVAEPAPLELSGDLAGDRKIERRDLLLDRGHVAGEVLVVVRPPRRDSGVGSGDGLDQIGHVDHSTR